MSLGDALLLIAGGLAAGVVNTMAGGGSVLTVPLLVLAGVPGNVANGSNRVGVLASSATAAWSFHRSGVPGLRHAIGVLVPTVLGSLVGALAIAQVADDTFERIFGLIMVPLLFLALRRPRPTPEGELRRWPAWLSFVVFFAIGVYGGAFQAGIGIVLVLALSHAGFDLVQANSIKVVVVVVVAATALPVFIANDLVDWGPALVLAVGFAAGGAIGARWAVKGGERVIRPFLVVATVALAGRMLGLY